jgi:hypothetical protein
LNTHKNPEMVVLSRLRFFEDLAQSSLTSLSVSSTIDVRRSLHCAIKNPKRRQGRVRFAVDASNSVLAEVISYKCNHSKFNSELYWTRNEMQEFRDNVRNVLAQMQEEQPELIRRMECVLNQCDRWSDGTQRADDRTCIQNWIHSNGRGLEALLSKQGARAKRAPVHNVLLCQSILQDQGLKPAEMSIALHACSVHATSHARRVALQLGEFDAHVV